MNRTSEVETSSGRDPGSGLSPWWRHAAILVMIFGFTILSIVTVKTYTNAPPIPSRVVDAAGATLFGKADIERGQEVFFKYGLMEHGTIWGHGAYLGPDYSAEYLHRLAEITRDTLAKVRFGLFFAELTPEQSSAIAEETRLALKENRYDAPSGALRFSPGEEASFTQQKKEWHDYFAGPSPAPGLPAGFITRSDELEALTAYFAWTAWAAVANRPGKNYSYTNNWPHEPLAGNTPSASTYLWSGLSLVTLLGGLGLVLFVFGKFDYLGWRGEKSADHSHGSRLANWQLSPSQRLTALYFVVVALLFLLQTLAGGALAHYRVEPGAFYGIDLAKVLPY